MYFVLMTAPLFHPNFGMFSFDQVANVEVDLGMYLKLFDRP